MKRRRILITGAAGFIGFHVMNKLAENNENEFVGFDNINDYYDTQLKFDRLSELGFDQNDIGDQKLIRSRTHEHLRFVRQDLENYEAMQQLFASEKF